MSVRKGGSESKPKAYKVFISMQPNWTKVIQWCFKDLKSDKQAWEFVANLFDDKDLKIDKKKSLYHGAADFDHFVDEHSGLNIIWSYNRQCFVEELELKQNVFTEGDGSKYRLWDKFPDNRIGWPMLISPDRIAFWSELPDGDPTEETTLSYFPYGDVMRLFASIATNLGNWSSNRMIKTFPKNIQEAFKKYEIEYDPWDYEDYGTGVPANKELVESEWLKQNNIELYDQRMRSHSFKSPYYTIRIRHDFFEAFNS